MAKIYKPETDGIDHINVYSKGKTALGRFLSNFADTPFTHPEDGKFRSIEGYWYWLGCKNDVLRRLSGFAAKNFGRSKGAPDWLDTDEFKRKIALAIKAKLAAYPDMVLELLHTDLPLVHYYVTVHSIIPVPEADWILEAIEVAAQELEEIILDSTNRA